MAQLSTNGLEMQSEKINRINTSMLRRCRERTSVGFVGCWVFFFFFLLHLSKVSGISMINFANRTNKELDLNVQMFVGFAGWIPPEREGPPGHSGS